MAAERTDPARAFLGVGWAFPPHLEPDGTVAEVAYDEDVRQAIRIILATNPGERVMRPDFGAGLKAFLFEPVDAGTAALVQTRVEEALTDFEPRIDLGSVQVDADPGERNVLRIEVSYRVRATNTQANLVFPFYLEEGTPT
jgi:uncharacterized protein